ncbi:MAG: YkvA family protein [Aequorivita sp.]|nr:YkvA family protein [Aequorivita sp.]
MSLKGIFSKSNYNPGNRDSGVSEEYVEEEVVKIKGGDVEIVMDNEEAISDKLSNASPLRKYTELGKIMFAMLKDVKKGSYPNVPWFTIASIVVALLYILNPFDLVPDFIPGIGYIDDLAVLSISMGWIETDLHKYLDWRLAENEKA